MRIGWVDTEALEEFFPDSDDFDDETLATLLGAAYIQCDAFLPPEDLVTRPLVIPDTWKIAQIMQARAIWRSARANSDGQMGQGDFTVTVFPMDWTVKALLRPRRIGRVL